MLILILWHTRVSLDDFRLIIGIIDSWSHLLLIVAVRVVGWVLLVMLVEYLSHISTWLVVTQAGLTLLLILSCCFNSVVLIRGCTILIVLACALFESLIVSFALVMAMWNYWLLQCIRIGVVSDLLLMLHHHQSLIWVSSWWVPLPIFNAKRICNIDSIVSFAGKLAWWLFWHTLTHKSLLLICKPRSVKLFLLAHHMTGIFCAWVVGVSSWSSLVEAIWFKHLLVR